MTDSENNALHKIIDSRQEWISDPGSVRLQKAPNGGWDIVVRIDGTYFLHDEALAVCDSFASEIAAAIGESTSVPTISTPEIPEGLSAPNPDDSTDHRISGSYSLTGEPLKPAPPRMAIAAYENDRARAAKLWGHAIVESTYASEQYDAVLDAARADGRLDKLCIALIEVAFEVDPKLKYLLDSFWIAQEAHTLADAAAQFAYIDGTGPDSVEWPDAE